MHFFQPLIETLSGFGAFTRVITRGKKYEVKPVKAFVCSSQSDKPMVRVGFAVTKGIKKSTNRNRIKRLMREAFRTQRKEIIKHIKKRTLIEIVFMYNGEKEIAPDMVRFASISRALSLLCAKITLVDPE